jgi:hypothetical protein
VSLRNLLILYKFPVSLEGLFYEYEAFKMLIKVEKAAAGVDKLPYWLFRKCAGSLTPVVTHVFNVILSSETPATAWKRAIVTPIPKVGQPEDY